MLPVALEAGDISIPALREEGDDAVQLGVHQNGLFLSPPSARRATRHYSSNSSHPQISIPALREEGDEIIVAAVVVFLDFYPRPPRGGRPLLLTVVPPFALISIPALREEGDPPCPKFNTVVPVFLSPPSARRATGALPSSAALVTYFYPRPPRGGRP